MEAGLEDAMAVMALPEKYGKQVRTTNMQERLNEEYPPGKGNSYLPQ